MKKIFLLFLMAFTAVTSSFALGFSIGGRGNLGGSFGNQNPSNNGTVLGGSIVANIDLFNGLGIQPEVNFISSTMTAGNNSITFNPCEIIDVPVMLWYNSYLGYNSPIMLGGGIGPNFSFVKDSSTKETSTIVGLALGLNAKYYFGEFFGIVAGINSVFDFAPTHKIKNDDGSVTISFDGKGKCRKAVFGSIGGEIRFNLF